MTKVYPFLFLLLVFGSLISGPLFIINTPQVGFHIISQALAEESSEEESSDSGDDEEKESDEQSDEESDEEKCVETEETEEETDDQPSEETCDNTDKDEESDEQVEKVTEEETEKVTEETQNDETSDSGAEPKEPTVLDVILNDDSLLKEVVDDNSTEAGLASSLTEIQEEQNQPAAETCGNEADDDGDGTIDEEDCVVPPTEICDNELDDDADGKADEADEDDCSTILPAVVIDSAEDEEGEPLSQGDIIAPGEITFTFSAKSTHTTDTQEDSSSFSFECGIDGESFSSCSSPATIKMEDGKHTFVVKLAQ